MKLLTIGLIVTVLSLHAATASAECNCLSVAAEVGASLQAEVARADNFYAKGDYDAALALYAKAYAGGKDDVLLYAQAMTQWQLGASAEAEALFEAYLEAGGAYSGRARAALGDIEGGVAATAGSVVGGVGGVLGVGAGAGGDVDLRGVGAKPKKVAKGAAIVLAIVAVAAVGAVAVQGIAAGLKNDIGDDIEFDKQFGIGMGLSGVVVGATAIYLYGLTAATGAVGGVCAADARVKPVVVPQIYRGGGGGLAAALTF